VIGEYLVCRETAENQVIMENPEKKVCFTIYIDSVELTISVRPTYVIMSNTQVFKFSAMFNILIHNLSFIVV